MRYYSCSYSGQQYLGLPTLFLPYSMASFGQRQMQAMIIYLQAQYRLGQETYDEAQTLSGAPAAQESAAPAAAAEETPFADSLRGLDLSKLRQVNGDVLGWIIIPGTNVSYPLVYSSQKSPTYYLSHTWDAEYGYVGSIFMEPENSPDFSDFNTVIYGHNMRNGSMTDEFAPFLRPNQYVDYTNAVNTVAKAAELTKGLTDPLAKVKAVYEFVVKTLKYDRAKASSVQSGYLPVLDTVLAQKKGICFDYASLMTAMEKYGR